MRFKLGQLVFLKSSFHTGEPGATVLAGYPAKPAEEVDIGAKPAEPEKYEIMIQSGVDFRVISLPGYALCDERGVGDSL